ncbi:hypothetical protein PE066_13700 [Ramlibacter tataouinensis]|uniref:hypothetical protein n=1 Tax=Ramlibacter tataouinensis TaxID=94132 RepID=UPI0022F3B601|nr:hypothetical protein [Ramlibacter tataouinensis]WBY00519.1 hypothetical protein PE066_13700 [Ramlibacter tataouinensis]
MSFVEFARSHGLLLEAVYPCDRIQRCPTERNPRRKNGAWFWDGERGFAFAWDGDAVAHWYDRPGAAPWTAAERQACVARQRELAAERERTQQDAAARAAALIAASRPGTHNYLVMKGLADAQGLITSDGALLVPMRDFLTDAVQGAQLIRWLESEGRYEKRMLAGMKAKGAVLRLGQAGDETCLVEGYATGLSAHAAHRSMGLKTSVLVTFSDRNLEYVAGMVKGKAYIYADNDKSQAGERAAKATGLPYCMSDVVGNDANDDHRQLGLFAVCKKLTQVRKLLRRDSG